jgi:stage VI sporulation protein D
VSQSSGQSLQFSINESVWLRDGEVAEEILSMALEPDITIEENTHYVSIKGALRLSGEYKPAEANEEERSVEDYVKPTFRTIDEVTDTDVGTCLMEHRFPVDITIPSGRIADIEDVYVTVETFDYQLPKQGCIQLEAEISISGLVDDERKDEEDDTTGIADVSYDPTEVTAFASFREPKNQESDKEYPQVELKQRPEEDADEDVFENFFADEEATFAKEPAYRSESGSYQPSYSYEEDEEEPDAVHPYLPLETETIPVDSKYEETWDDEEEMDEESVVHTKRRNENALYLTKMLTNEEDQFTKVKVCIVQNGDSLETLSARYEVPITTILRRNRLESDSVDEGQVLYIPVSKRG